MSKKKSGLRVGSYRITPLGIITVILLVLALVFCAWYFLIRDDSADHTSLLPGGGADQHTPAPVSEPAQTPVGDETEAEVTQPAVLVTNTPTIPPQTPTPKPAPTPTATPLPVAGDSVIRFLGEIRGDLDIVNAASDGEDHYSFADMLSSAGSTISDCDYTVAWVRGTLGGNSSDYSAGEKIITPEALITDLADQGVDMLALANDHALDHGYLGVKQTVDRCTEAGLDITGVSDPNSTDEVPVLTKVNNVDIAFLNFTIDLEKGSAKAQDESTVAWAIDTVSKDRITDITKAREAGAKAVICIVAWGNEDDTKKQEETQKKVIQALANAGADAIIGYGTQIPGEVMTVKSKAKDGTERTTLVCTSVGTLLAAGNSKKNNDFGTVFELSVKVGPEGRISLESPASIPTYCWKTRDENGKTAWRVLTVSEWYAEQPSGMEAGDYKRLRLIKEKIDKLTGTVTTIR